MYPSCGALRRLQMVLFPESKLQNARIEKRCLEPSGLLGAFEKNSIAGVQSDYFPTFVAQLVDMGNLAGAANAVV